MFFTRDIINIEGVTLEKVVTETLLHKLTRYKFKELFIYFIIYSFIGWLIEVIVLGIYNKKLIHRGNMSGPFLSIYGIGAVMMLLFLDSYIDNIISLFAASMILMTLLEYFVHWLLEKTFKMKWWDYSHNFINIKGRVCLLYSLCWGFLGVIMIQIVHPVIYPKVLQIITNASMPFNIFIGFLLIYYIIDSIWSIPKIIKIRDLKLKEKFNGYFNKYVKFNNNTM